MTAAERSIRLAVATLPAVMRERYREQWLADLRDADEVGISRVAIVAGALAFSVRLGRTAEVRGYTLSELMLRRLRWGTALILSVTVLGIGAWFSGLNSAVVGNTLSVAAIYLLGVVMLITFCVGLAQLIAAARAANRMALAGALLVAVGALGVVAPLLPGIHVPADYWAGGFTVLVCFVLLGVGATLALTGFLGGLSGVQLAVSRAQSVTSSAQRARAGILASIAMATLLAFGTYETLVIGPLAQAPGYTIDEIYAMLSSADRSSGIASALVWLVFWGLVVVGFLVLCLARGRFAHTLNARLTPRRILLLALVLASIIIFFHWWSGFSLGMSIADTIPPYVGGRSWQSQVLSLVGSLMFVAGILLALAPGPRRTPAASAPTFSLSH